MKKAPPKMKSEVEKSILLIIENPFIGESLSGNLRGLKKFRIYGKPEYRIIYAVYECEEAPEACRFSLCESEEKETCLGIIDFLDAGSREAINHFYKKPRKEILQWLREVNE